MSSFSLTLTHKVTKLEHHIFAIDDYFGKRIYGYKLPDGEVVNDDELDKLYEKE